MKILESYNFLIALILTLYGAQDIYKGGRFLLVWVLFLPITIYFLVKVVMNLRNRFMSNKNEK